jgi:hypothetical protein
MNDELQDILDELVSDLQDENLRKEVADFAAQTLPLPDMIERRIITLIWAWAAKKLEQATE